MRPLWKPMYKFLKRLQIDPPHDSATPLLGTLPKGLISYHREPHSSIFIGALFTVARKRKQPKWSLTDEWTVKLWYICKMKCHSVIKKSQISIFFMYIALCNSFPLGLKHFMMQESSLNKKVNNSKKLQEVLETNQIH